MQIGSSPNGEMDSDLVRGPAEWPKAKREGGWLSRGKMALFMALLQQPRVLRSERGALLDTAAKNGHRSEPKPFLPCEDGLSDGADCRCIPDYKSPFFYGVASQKQIIK